MSFVELDRAKDLIRQEAGKNLSPAPQSHAQRDSNCRWLPLTPVSATSSKCGYTILRIPVGELECSSRCSKRDCHLTSWSTTSHAGREAMMNHQRDVEEHDRPFAGR